MITHYFLKIKHSLRTNFSFSLKKCRTQIVCPCVASKMVQNKTSINYAVKLFGLRLLKLLNNLLRNEQIQAGVKYRNKESELDGKYYYKLDNQHRNPSISALNGSFLNSALE